MSNMKRGGTQERKRERDRLSHKMASDGLDKVRPESRDSVFFDKPVPDFPEVAKCDKRGLLESAVRLALNPTHRTRVPYFAHLISRHPHT